MENIKGSNANSIHGDDISLPSPATSSSIDPKMMELMASQTQSLHKMAQTMENVQLAVSTQAPLLNNNNHTVVDRDHKISLILSQPPFNKEKLLAMQTQAPQGRMQCEVSTPHHVEMAKAGVPRGPVRRQAAEAWNNQRNKRSRRTSDLEVEEQHNNIKALGTCLCCESYGLPCLQREASLMTDEARQRYYLDIIRKREVTTQGTILEGDAQDQDNIQTMKLEDWSISVKEFQPWKNKRSKEQIIEARQDKRLPETSGTRYGYDQSVGSRAQDIITPELVHHQHNHPINIQNMNLEDWSISVKEFQPRKNKRSKKKIIEESQYKRSKKQIIEASQDKRLQDGTCYGYDQPVGSRAQDIITPELVHRQHNHPIKKDPAACALPPRDTVEQKGSQDGQKEDNTMKCCNRSKSGHHTRRCPTKKDGQEKKDNTLQCCKHSKSGYHTRRCPAKKGVDESQWYCFNCGKEGLLADQCPLNQKYRKKGQSMPHKTVTSVSQGGLKKRKGLKDLYNL